MPPSSDDTGWLDSITVTSLHCRLFIDEQARCKIWRAYRLTGNLPDEEASHIVTDRASRPLLKMVYSRFAPDPASAPRPDNLFYRQSLRHVRRRSAFALPDRSSWLRCR